MMADEALRLMRWRIFGMLLKERAKRKKLLGLRFPIPPANKDGRSR